MSEVLITTYTISFILSWYSNIRIDIRTFERDLRIEAYHIFLSIASIHQDEIHMDGQSQRPQWIDATVTCNPCAASATLESGLVGAAA